MIWSVFLLINVASVGNVGLKTFFIFLSKVSKEEKVGARKQIKKYRNHLLSHIK
jgi:hypothetical protein